MGMSKKYSKYLHVSIAAILAASLTQGANAQDSEGKNAGDIVVTANKREQRLLDVPASVTAIRAENLIGNQQTSIADYYTRVPGLSISDSGTGRTSLAIRGVTTGNTQHATVGIVIDDIPFTSTGGTSVSPNLTPDLDPAILQRIEVLRGPQGTLYGAATLGGLLKFVTAQPVMEGMKGFGQADINNVAHGDIGYSLRGGVNTALIEGAVGLSVNGFYRRDAGFVDDISRNVTDYNSADNYGGRAELKAQLSDAVDVRLGALMQKTNSDGQGTIRTNYLLEPVSGLDYPTFPGVGDRKSQVQFYSAIVNADLGGDVTFTSLTGYVRNKYDQDTSGTLNQFAASLALFGVRGNYIRNYYTTKKFSQEIRFAGSNPEALEWMIGGFYTTEKSYSLQEGFAIDPTTGAVPGKFFEFLFPSTFNEAAVFADLTYHVSDRFQIQVGGRYSKNDQTYYEADTGPRFPTPTIFEKVSKDNSATFLVASKYNITDDLMLYGRVASGYRPGGPQTAAFGPVVPTQVDPDTTVNYELGLKGQLFDKMVEFETAIFRVDWDDIQLSQNLPGYGLFYINAGKARVQGIESSLQIFPVDGMTLAGNIAYTDAELRTAGVGFVGAKGDRLPWSSKWSWNVSADYEFGLGGTSDGFIGGSVAYVGDRHGVFPTNVAAVRQFFPHYTTTDVRAGVRFNDKYTLTLFAKNLFDELGYLSSGVIQGTANKTAFYATSIIRPRTIGVSLAARF